MINLSELKTYIINLLIGSLIVSALIAVLTVLLGEFNEIFARVLLTLFMVLIHSLICLGFIWDDEKQNTFERLAFFSNVSFLLIILSLFTSIFGTWEVFSSEMTWNLYQTYFVLAFASLHGDILSKALGKEKYLDNIINVNYLFMAIVVLMLQFVIYVEEAKYVLGEMFFRILGAIGIVDGTLSILVIIFYKLYMHKHPKIDNELAHSEKKGLSIWVWILIVYLITQIIFPLFFLMFRLF